METLLLLLVLGFMVAFAIGSNEEAMSPAVGAKILTVNVAVVIGGLVTLVGAILVGGNVSERVGSDLVGGRALTPAMVFSVLAAMSIWLIAMSAAKGLPISTTQSVVGSVLGVVLVGPMLGEVGWGVEAMDWSVVAQIVVGWILSPIIGLLISALVSAFVRRLRQRGQGLVGFERQDRVASIALLAFLVLTSFSRGGNDVASAVAPLFAVQELADMPLVPLAVGGIGMALGLMTVGRRVIRTVATGIVMLSPTTALSASVSVSLVLFSGTILGLPLSGTHVLMAALVAVGWMERTSIRRDQIRNIVVSWLITVPLSALLAAAILAVVSMAV